MASPAVFVRDLICGAVFVVHVQPMAVGAGVQPRAVGAGENESMPSCLRATLPRTLSSVGEGAPPPLGGERAERLVAVGQSEVLLPDVELMEQGGGHGRGLRGFHGRGVRACGKLMPKTVGTR